MSSYYLRVEDFARACIGPFATVEAAQQHYAMTKERGDGAAFISINNTAKEDGDDITLTPQQDIDGMVE